MRYRSFAALLFPLILLAVSAPARADRPFRDLYDLDTLPLLRPDVRTHQVSSHDPTGGNGDAGHFVRVTGNVKVLADLKGPGIVRRIWSANPSGRIRITIDGASRPAVDAPFTDLFEDRVEGFRSPVAGRSSGGWYSYVPIPFQKSCLITVTDGGPFYYQVTWQSVPDASEITPFTGRIGGEDASDYDDALAAWTHLGENLPDEHALPLPDRPFSLPKGGRWAQPIQGPGTITGIRFDFASGTTFEDLRQAVLRISFDGNQPSVEVPLGDFFGVGFDGEDWKSLPLGYGPEGAYCYFRMPFRRAARIEVENQGKRTLRATFSGTARPGVPSEPWGYFHAGFRRAINEAGQDYLFGRLRGAGHVVGVTESMRGTGNLWFLEGDERVFVDGEATPSIAGTGTEDFYNCGWYFNAGPVNVATHGCGRKTDNEVQAWRMFLSDPIPFDRSLDFRIEHGGTDDAPGSEYASVLYWYGPAATVDVGAALPKGASLLPKPYIAPIAGATEAVTLTWSVSGKGTVKKQPWQQVSAYRGGGRVLLKGRPGASAATPLEARFTDRYDVDLYLSGVNTSSTARLIVDGKVTGPTLRDASGPLPIRKVSIGGIPLAEGSHRFGLKLASGTAIALDAFRLTPRSPLVTRYAVLGPFPADPQVGVNAKLGPDGKEPDLSATYSAGGASRAWHIMQTPNGILDLGATLSPNENVVAYAAFAVKSPVAQTVPLMVGSDDGVAVWVNGRNVSRHRVDRGLTLDEDRVPVGLAAGWNTVVLKVDQGAGGWQVAARIPDPEHRLEFAPIAPATR